MTPEEAWRHDWLKEGLAGRSRAAAAAVKPVQKRQPLTDSSDHHVIQPQKPPRQPPHPTAQPLADSGHVATQAHKPRQQPHLPEVQKVDRSGTSTTTVMVQPQPLQHQNTQIIKGLWNITF